MKFAVYLCPPLRREMEEADCSSGKMQSSSKSATKKKATLKKGRINLTAITGDPVLSKYSGQFLKSLDQV